MSPSLTLEILGNPWAKKVSRISKEQVLNYQVFKPFYARLGYRWLSLKILALQSAESLWRCRTMRGFGLITLTVSLQMWQLCSLPSSLTTEKPVLSRSLIQLLMRCSLCLKWWAWSTQAWYWWRARWSSVNTQIGCWKHRRSTPPRQNWVERGDKNPAITPSCKMCTIIGKIPRYPGIFFCN